MLNAGSAMCEASGPETKFMLPQTHKEPRPVHKTHRAFDQNISHSDTCVILFHPTQSDFCSSAHAHLMPSTRRWPEIWCSLENTSCIKGARGNRSELVISTAS